MSTLIYKGQIDADPYVELDDATAVEFGGHFIVSLARWRKDYSPLSICGSRIGVRIPNTVEISREWMTIARLPLIVLEFPSFADGRAYSQARTLIERCGYEGELRATGAAVVEDQIQFMLRCGFNSFELRADQDPEACLRAMHTFSLAYQRAADTIEPVFARRRARSA
jgi:uncharacterized protein (DUF934 family)